MEVCIKKSKLNSEQPMSLKISISCSQVLRVKRKCSMIEILKLYCLERKQKFIERAYKSDSLDKHISTDEKLGRNEIS